MSLGDDLLSWEVDPRSNSVLVGVAAVTPELVDEARARFGDRITLDQGDRMTLMTGRFDNLPNYIGGNRIRVGGGLDVCRSGFTITNAHGQKYGLSRVGGLASVEPPAVFRAGAHLYLTYSDPNCGYCSGTGISYLYSMGGMLGPWHAGGRISDRSCSGQPRSVSWINGAVTEWIDQWTPSGAPNQTRAAIRLEPLSISVAPPIQPTVLLTRQSQSRPVPTSRVGTLRAGPISAANRSSSVRCEQWTW